MLEFQIAPIVQPDQPLTSGSINRQARAFNDRILSGVGNCAERIVDYAWGLGRQIRNPDTSDGIGIGNWPYADEWLRIYAYSDPRNGGLPWPADGMEPGEPQGVSLSNPLGAFVFGNAASGLDPEEDRISQNGGTNSPGIPLWMNFGDGLREPRTPAEGWALGKLQRGGIDPASGVMSAPAITSAQAHYRIQYPSWSRFLAAYGGMLPTREKCTVDGGYVDCGDVLYYDGDTPKATPRFEVLFTPTAYGASIDRQVRRFDGFCPPGSPNAGAACGGVSEASLAGIGYSEWWYTLYVYVSDGSGGYTTQELEKLSTAEYVEGPYTGGGSMARDVRGGRHLNVVMNWFLHDFRGSKQQIGQTSYDPSTTAFNYGKFFERQYLLSPAKGQVSGNEIAVTYPRFTWQSGCADGTAGVISGGSTQHAIAEHFVCAGACASASGLQAPVKVRLINGATSQVLTELQLTPDENGKASASWWPETAERITVAAVVVGSPTLSGGGSLWLEIAELWAWKPTIPDAYLVLRMASTRGGSVVNLDTDGVDVASPVGAWANYSTLGCVVNAGAAGASTLSYITESPIYEAARRLIVGNVRLAAKPQLLNYAVQDGKSVFWFKRFAVLSNHSFDLFTGIAPSRDPIANGNLQNDVQYRLQSGEIRYQGVIIHGGDTFTAGDAGAWEATENSTGSEQVYEITAIRINAPPRGASNRWVMWGSFNAYRNDPASIWKEELYDNSILYHNRCHTLSPQLPKTGALNMHFTFAQSLALISEGLPAYTFAEGVNSGFGFGEGLSPDARADQYRSCLIYPPPYEIESAVDEPGDVVKITMKGRLRHCPGAPSSITPNPISWTWLSGSAVQYRTDENAICEYLRYMAGGADCKNTSEPYADNPDPETGDPRGFSWQIGDMANPNEQYKFGSDRPKGACLPRLYFVRLVDEVWEDGTNVPDAKDTRPRMDTMAQREMYLRAIAGGWIDESATTTLSCDSGHLFDYSFENLCMDAFGGRAIPTIDPSRGNPWGGHGPLPATKFWSGPFNAISAAVNKLRLARVMLPIEVRSRQRTTAGKAVVGPNYRITPMGPGCNMGSEAVDSSINGAFWNSVFGVPSTGWFDSCSVPGACEYADGWGGASASRFITPLSAPGEGIRVACSGGNYEYLVWSQHDSGHVIVNPEHPALLALTSDQRSRFAEAPGFLGWITTRIEYLVRDDVNGSNGTACGPDPNSKLPDAWGVKWRNVTSEESHCVLYHGGPMVAPELPATAIWYHHPTFETPCVGGASASISFTPINDRDLFLSIPLVDSY